MKTGIRYWMSRPVTTGGEGSTAIGIDRVMLKPTLVAGEFDFQMKMVLDGRSGVMEEAFGRYKGNGSASFNTGAVHHEGRGKVCGLRF